MTRPENGTAPTGRSRRGEPRTYDFRRPTKLSREHVRVLQIAQEAFARQTTTVLTTMLRAGARLELLGIEQHSYDDYVASLPDPCFLATFTIEPLAGKGVLAYPLDIAMAAVDHMLGGSGAADQPDRPMTVMETAITNHLLNRLLQEFTASFTHVVELQPEIDTAAGPFMDTAAIMTLVELVITSDTATAHLAGGLGVPVWLATPFAPDWRWLTQREDSPWYPSMRLFRQTAIRRWDDVFARMAAEISKTPST